VASCEVGVEGSAAFVRKRVQVCPATSGTRSQRVGWGAFMGVSDGWFKHLINHCAMHQHKIWRCTRKRKSSFQIIIIERYDGTSHVMLRCTILVV
jgi:hypothetical protein